MIAEVRLCEARGLGSVDRRRNWDLGVEPFLILFCDCSAGVLLPRLSVGAAVHAVRLVFTGAVQLALGGSKPFKSCVM